MSAVRLAAVRLGGALEAWERLGFNVDAAGLIRLANGAIDASQGLAAGLVVESDVACAADVDGVPVAAGEALPGVDHPNGASSLDHVVLITDSLERTSAAVEERFGLPQRRVREGHDGRGPVRQAFHRFGRVDGIPGCIVEIVESPRTLGPTALFGVVVIVAELDALCAELGPDLIAPPKPAVQPGRSIATVRRAAGLATPVALMTPEPAS